MKIRCLKGYNFQLPNREYCKTGITGYKFLSRWFTLSTSGLLTIDKDYCWDGPSFPAIKTKNFLLPSLIHDVLYQAIREGNLPEGERKAVDKELRNFCLRSGMSKLRAWYVFRWVRLFGQQSALPRKRPRGKILEVFLKL